MSLPATTLSELQQMMAQTPALLGKLQCTNDAMQAAAVIAEAAVQKGIVITQAELVTYFEQTAQNAARQALSDAQLEAIAGGLNHDEFIAISVFTIGLGCLALSSEKARIRYAKPGEYATPKFCLS